MTTLRPHHHTLSRCGPSASRAFTLIELILTLVVLAVLITILAFNATATSTALNVRTGWVTLGEAQLAARTVAQGNINGYYYPTLQAGGGCVSQISSTSSAAPTSTGLTFFYNCPSTSTTVVSITTPGSTTMYLTLLVSSSTCLVMVDQLSGTSGDTTNYGLDASVASGHCDAADVTSRIGSITSTSSIDPSSLTGLL
jgi:prepilin-type N-terminal cleavage/methylation domain-containing protein